MSARDVAAAAIGEDAVRRLEVEGLRCIYAEDLVATMADAGPCSGCRATLGRELVGVDAEGAVFCEFCIRAREARNVVAAADTDPAPADVNARVTVPDAPSAIAGMPVDIAEKQLGTQRDP